FIILLPSVLVCVLFRLLLLCSRILFFFFIWYGDHRDLHSFLHDALPIYIGGAAKIMGEESFSAAVRNIGADIARIGANFLDAGRSEEHTSELQSRENLVCRLLLEKKK